MTCIFCQAKMILATESRGYKTYRCKRGCDYHVHIEIDMKNPNRTTQISEPIQAQQ